MENLFPAHPKANRAKSDIDPPGGLCLPGDGVDRRLVHKLQTDSSGVHCMFAALDPADAAAANTAALLGKLHHGTNVHRYSDDLRDAIGRRLMDVFRAMVRFWLATDPTERAAHAATVRRMVDRDGPFHALLMSVPEVKKFLAEAG